MFTQMKRKVEKGSTEPINGGKTFNYGKQRLCILKTRNGIFSSKFGFGVAIPTEEADELAHKIGYVQRRSPASSSGLRVNDVIVNINGHDADEFTHEDIVTYLREYNREELRLVVVQPVQGDLEPLA